MVPGGTLRYKRFMARSQWFFAFGFTRYRAGAGGSA